MINNGATADRMITIKDEQQNNNWNYQRRDKKSPKKSSVFRYVISHNYMGLSYLFLDSKMIDPITALQDALEVGKFQLVLTLISKASNEGLQKENELNQSLFHVLANYNRNDTNFNLFCEKIVQALLSRNVKLDRVDKNGNSSLHFAVQNGHEILVKLFLKHGISVNVQNSEKRTPLHYVCIKNRTNIANILLDVPKCKVNELDKLENLITLYY